MSSIPSPDVPARALTLTGERTLPGIPDETYWFQRHVVAYERACVAIAGLAVLDAGCGEGYGLRMLRDAGARRVVGADLDEKVVAHVRRTYATAGSGIEAVACELMSLPLADGEVDRTVSFQVIEHLHDIPGYLRSLARVTRRGGEVWIATPNRLTFTPGSDTPVNPFHTREFTAAELARELTRAGLEVAAMLGVRHGPRLRAAEDRAGGTLPDQLASDPAAWPDDLRRLVHGVTSADFEISDADLDASLDLLAIARVP